MIQKLHDTGIYTHDTAKILNMSVNDVDDKRDAYEKELNRLAAERIKPDVRNDFPDAVTESELIGHRLSHLKREYKVAQSLFCELLVQELVNAA